jgi:hypothetical protein
MVSEKKKKDIVDWVSIPKKGCRSRGVTNMGESQHEPGIEIGKA